MNIGQLLKRKNVYIDWSKVREHARILDEMEKQGIEIYN